MKIGICDDDITMCSTLKAHCLLLGYENIILYNSGEALLESSDFSSLDILFLDIELEELSGIEIKNLLENSSTYIVFCTTHSEFMPDAFGRNVIGFLQKPVTAHQIERCLKKAAYLKRDYYTVALDEKITICCKDILYLHTEQKYTVFYTLDKTTFSSRKSLHEFEKELSNLGFCFIQRSYLMNLKYFDKITGQNLTLTTGQILPVSRRCLKPLKEAYHNYMVSKMTYQ